MLLKLELEQFHNNILWYQRLHSAQLGKVRIGKPGTPDIISIVNCHNGKIAILFLEVKRSGVKQLRYEQKIFFKDMEGKSMILCRVINDHKMLSKYIKEAQSL